MLRFTRYKLFVFCSILAYWGFEGVFRDCGGVNQNISCIFNNISPKNISRLISKIYWHTTFCCFTLPLFSATYWEQPSYLIFFECRLPVWFSWTNWQSAALIVQAGRGAPPRPRPTGWVLRHSHFPLLAVKRRFSCPEVSDFTTKHSSIQRLSILLAIVNTIISLLTTEGIRRQRA